MQHLLVPCFTFCPLPFFRLIPRRVTTCTVGEVAPTYTSHLRVASLVQQVAKLLSEEIIPSKTNTVGDYLHETELVRKPFSRVTRAAARKSSATSFFVTVRFSHTVGWGCTSFMLNRAHPWTSEVPVERQYSVASTRAALPPRGVLWTPHLLYFNPQGLVATNLSLLATNMKMIDNHSSSLHRCSERVVGGHDAPKSAPPISRQRNPTVEMGAPQEAKHPAAPAWR